MLNRFEKFLEERFQLKTRKDNLRLVKNLDQINAVNRASQILLQLKYRELMKQVGPMPSLRDVEFRSYSQNGEDGILLYLFTVLGMTDRRAVEVCCAEGIECNSANLIVNHGWTALLVDGDERRLALGRAFYRRSRDTWVHPPTMVKAWVEPENINALLEENGFTGDLDLLTIDIDGMDYWVWKALTVARPRVVVVEISNRFGADQAMAQRYQKGFSAGGAFPLTYTGSSLAAFVKLGRDKGYRLVGCEKYAINAFFVRDDLGKEPLPEVSASDCLTHPRVAERQREGIPAELLKHWEEV